MTEPRFCACEIFKRWRADVSIIEEAFNQAANRGLMFTTMERTGHVLDGKEIIMERVWMQKF